MKGDLEVWHLIVMFMSFVACCWTFGVVLMAQFEKRLDERFKARDIAALKVETEAKAALKDLAASQHQLEVDFLTFQGALPNIYTRRDDFIRVHSVIELKVDALASQISELKNLVTLHERS